MSDADHDHCLHALHETTITATLTAAIEKIVLAMRATAGDDVEKLQILAIEAVRKSKSAEAEIKQLVEAG